MHTINKKNLSIITTDTLKDEINQQWFEQDYWMNQGRLLGANSGRGSTWVIKSAWGKWVLRHYFRGGFYAKINRDRYLWTGLSQTRAYQEFKLLQHIQSLGLPSPKPVGALVSRQGLFYRNDLIMEHIQHEMTLAQGIRKEHSNESEQPVPSNVQQIELTPKMWRLVGTTIAQYHHNGIYHSDLNAHNILLNHEQVFVIDFDKGQIKGPNRQWQQDNMNRLKRSIEKITNKSCDSAMQPEWHSVLEGYYG